MMFGSSSNSFIIQEEPLKGRIEEEEEEGEDGPLLRCISDVIRGTSASVREDLIEFTQYLHLCLQVNKKNIAVSEDCFYRLVASFQRFDISQLRPDLLKEGSILSALWVIFLRLHRQTFPAERFKYASLAEFMTEYDHRFDAVDVVEQEKLFAVANWMNSLFRTIPAKRNKGFFIHIVPKFLEGFEVKYTLGTGQSRATSHRADIFEHEGKVTAGKRSYHLPGVRQQQSEAEKALVQNLFSSPLLPAQRNASLSSSLSSSCSENMNIINGTQLAAPLISERKVWSSSSSNIPTSSAPMGGLKRPKVKKELSSSVLGSSSVVVIDQPDTTVSMVLESFEGEPQLTVMMPPQEKTEASRQQQPVKIERELSLPFSDSLGDVNYTPSFDMPSSGFEMS